MLADSDEVPLNVVTGNDEEMWAVWRLGQDRLKARVHVLRRREPYYPEIGAAVETPGGYDLLQRTGIETRLSHLLFKVVADAVRKCESAVASHTLV